MSVLKYESKKVFIKQYALFIFLAVIVIKLFSLPDSMNVDYGFKTVTEKNKYLETIKPLAGILT